MLQRTVLLILVTLLIGCDSGEADTTLRAPGGRTPVAGAIEIRSSNNEFLGVLGGWAGEERYLGTLSPSGCTPTSVPGEAAAPAILQLTSAYPNPTRGRAIISVDLPCATDVAAFVVAALPPGSPAPSRGASTLGSWVFRSGGLPVAIIHDGPLTAGSHSLDIDLDSSPRGALPDGYYRVYVRTPYVVAWSDVLLDRTHSFPN